nr:hypothetical protein [Tanacetum cinerariifolium]
MGKKIGELHALRIEYENGLPKKVATPQVMAIQGGRIHKANKKSLNAKGKSKGKGKGKDKSYIPNPKNPKPSVKEHPTKNDASHHSNSLLEEFADELALISYPPDYDDYRACDIESDIREIEFLFF